MGPVPADREPGREGGRAPAVPRQAPRAAARASPATLPRSTHDAGSIPVHAPAAADGHEREAQQHATRLRRPAGAGGVPGRRRPVRRTPAPHASLHGGRPLAAAERATAEPALGLDLTTVRVHDGPAAAVLAASHRARAFTYGSHVVLGHRAQASASTRRATLAHELVHVGQQAAAHDPAGDHLARGPPGAVPTLRQAPLGVQCQAEDDSLLPAWVTRAAGAVTEAGAEVVGAAVELGGRAADFALETAAAVVDRLAPGLLAFLRGGALGQVTELLCTGVGTLLDGFFAQLGELDVTSAIESTFRELAGDVREVQAALGSAASSAVGTVLRPLIGVLLAWGGPLVDTIRSVTGTVNSLLTGLWDNFAAPAVDFLGRVGGAVWEAFTRLGTWLWDLTKPIREGAAAAWDWLSKQFGLAWDSTSGVRDYLGGLATRAWDELRRTFEPIRKPLMAAAGVLLLLSPLGPVIVLTQVVPPLWEKLRWLWDNWNTKEILATAHAVLREDVLPAVVATAGGVVSAMATAAAWLADRASQVGVAMSGVIDTFGGSRCLQGATRWLRGIAGQFARLGAWAAAGFEGLVPALTAVFEAVVAMFRPIIDFLTRLALVVANPFMLPVALAGAIWLLCPEELKAPVINLVLDLLIAAVDAFPAFLLLLVPLASLLKAGVLGFLRHLRGEELGDEQRIAASDKIANLAAGGGLAFIAGFGFGLLRGLIDGIIDPFRLIFMLVQLLVAGVTAVGRLVAAFVPGAATREPVARAPPAETPGAPAAAPGQPPVPAEVAAGPTDAAIVAALPPGTLEQTAGAPEPAVDPAQLEAGLSGELQTQGATVPGLASLLADAWQTLMAGAESIGGRAAAALIEFILLPDFELGDKLGFVTGFVLLQGLIIYFSAGGYAALKAVQPALRQVLVYLLRFLDLGGELLAGLGKLLRPLKGPILAGLGAARGLLSRFRFAAGLIERVEGLAGRLFGLGDEVAGAAARGVRETGEEAAGRVTQQVAETAETRLGREAAEEAGGRAAAQPADELGEGALKAADDPKVPTVGDEAARAAELPEALIEARAIETFHDAIDSPVPLLLGSLMLLKRHYRWIETFTATPIGIGVYRVELVASPGIPVGTYTVDMRRTRNTLGRIHEGYKELLATNPALNKRFTDIAKLAPTDPTESARLATALEEELLEAERLAGGAVREITTVRRAEPGLPRADERYSQAVAGLEESRVFGQLAEEYGDRFIRGRFRNVADQVRIRPLLDNGQPADFYFIADNLGMFPTSGRSVAFDSKLSSLAPTTPNQAIGYPLLGRNGGIVESRGLDDLGFPHGHQLPPTPVYRVQPRADLRVAPPASPNDFRLIPLT
jgi:Domain of unknown function (DUF4157)